MGSCVSKKAARPGAGAKSKASAPPLPVAEKETTRALPPVAEAIDEEEVEEVKEVVLSEAPPPPRPPAPAPVKQRQQPVADDEEEDESAPSEACSASDAASVESAAKEKAKAKLLHKLAGAEERDAAEKKVVAAPDAPRPRKGRRSATPVEEKEGKARGAGNARARSPSPSSAHSRRQHPPEAVAPRPRRREQPAVVSGIGCRSGRFSPSAARRAAESAAVRRTHSAREADMALPSSTKRSLTAAINGGLSKRDAGERSGRRSDSPTAGRRAPANPMRKAAKEHGTPERTRPRARDGDEQPPLPEGAAGGGEHRKVEEGALGQNPSVAMECFIFL